MTAPLTQTTLPAPTPARVLACGAFLKNTACLIEPDGNGGTRVWWSPLHDDLGTPAACAALQASVAALVAAAGGPIAAVAHDLHPDFHSTQVAAAWAQRLGVPALAVQHHHAHIAVVQAELGLGDHTPLIGLALDGVGHGSDGTAWGGELLRVQHGRMWRLAHLPLLPLPGGDAAAREPWRLAAAVWHRAGRAAEIVPRLGAAVGEAAARGVAQLLARDLRCPRSSGAGRWFDAAAGVLGLSLHQAHEAEAAIALEQAATAWLQGHADPVLPAPSLDLWPLLIALLDEADAGRGAARFHLALAEGLVQAAAQAAAQASLPGQPARVVLGGGCFFNRLLSQRVSAGLQAHGLSVHRPVHVGCGDAGLALGQAWAAALQCAATATFEGGGPGAGPLPSRPAHPPGGWRRVPATPGPPI
ncbi:Kae1-like domain-containing protein [Aquabacterium sp. OR-4]|uniref:Kae1-like domain-containing protein n=1 Tax=Aquabacterium sp. OR-4 TaxID=2978127 RepID=UPI0028C6F85E|nr:carbamoyltransferase HypF [Aquabacterium sp. OR-4]MDT7833619.1 carbamoyltransferase HypF [Aquabacterium sp. OR-4]